MQKNRPFYYTVVEDLLRDPRDLYRKMFGVSAFDSCSGGLAVAVLKWIRGTSAKIHPRGIFQDTTALAPIQVRSLMMKCGTL